MTIEKTTVGNLRGNVESTRNQKSNVDTVKKKGRASEDGDSYKYLLKNDNNGFYERPSAPDELLPSLVGATVHTYRYTTFIRETDLRGIAIEAGDCVGSRQPGKPDPLTEIFTENGCPVLHLGYIAGHLQHWTSNGTALGEIVYNLSLAPGETRNIAVIDLRRRQQSRRGENTTANEQLISDQDHTFALQEVATAVALEHQFGKTRTEANTMVSGGAFVAAGALVGGVAGGVVGTLVEPGGGTVGGAALGAGAGVVAGGMVFAGAQALGMIESESSGGRDIIGKTNQRIAQSTSQQSALIRSLWSTVVTEDAQDEHFAVKTSNVTNYNHMHALNMEYYEILHRYDTETELQDIKPLLYLPFGALPLQNEALVDEFWDSIRNGLSEDLQEKGDHVFVAPPPEAFVPEDVPEPLSFPPNMTFSNLSIDVEIEWDFDLKDAIFAAFGYALAGTFGAYMSGHADDIFQDVHVEIELNGDTYIQPLMMSSENSDPRRGVTSFNALFPPSPLEASEVTGVRVAIFSPADPFDDGINLRVLVRGGTVSPPNSFSLTRGQRIGGGKFEYQSSGRGEKVYPWSPVAEMIQAFQEREDEIAAIEQRNADGAAAHAEILAQLAQWKTQVLDAVKREPYRFTAVILSSMETGRLTWILDRLYLAGDDQGETGAIPLHRIADTVPLGISGDSVLLRMKSFDLGRVLRTASEEWSVDQETAFDFKILLTWPEVLKKRFDADTSDLTIRDSVFLPGAGVFAEAVLGRSNASEYIDPERYWNWQDSPIPHQAPDIQPVSTNRRDGAPLPTAPTVPDATLPLVNAPDFPAPVGLTGVLQAVQNGNMFRDMSKTDQLAGILGGLANLAAGAANTAASMTGNAASSALNSATDIGKTVASMTETLMAKAPAQAAQPPKNPTTAAAATSAVERAQNKSADVLDVTKDAWGVPGSSSPSSGEHGVTSQEAPATGSPSWRPQLPSGPFDQPGQVSTIPPVPSRLQEEMSGELKDVLETAAEENGAMPDSRDLILPLERFYRDGVMPLLVFARHNEEYLTSAIQEYLRWLEAMQALGLDSEIDQMESLHGDAKTLIRVGLENAIQSGFSQMEANNNLDYLQDVLNWVATAVSLGIEDESQFFDVSTLKGLSPIHVVLNGPIEPQAGFAVGDQFELSVSGGMAIGFNPPLKDRVVQVSVSVDNGISTPSSGVVHPALDFISTVERSDTAPMVITVTGNASLLQDAWDFETVRSVTLS